MGIPQRDVPPLVKEPWLAVNLSYLVPGIGQFYAGAWAAGTTFLAGSAVLAVAAQRAFLAADGSVAFALLAAILLANFWLLNVHHAHRCARNLNTPEANRARRRAADPYLAVFLTQPLPGIGHFYLRRWGMGLLLTTVTFALWVVPQKIEFFLLLFFLLEAVHTAVVCGLAWIASPPSPRKATPTIVALCLLVAARGLLLRGSVVQLRQYAIEPILVSLHSMSPTIHSGDIVLVWKASSYEPRRGDVIMFRGPQSNGLKYTKRVAALGGETIEIRRGGVYVDGRRLREGAFGRFTYVAAPDQQYAAEGRPYTVPAGELFVLGDNSVQSTDSRSFGPIRLDEVLGKVYKRCWPLPRAGPID